MARKGKEYPGSGEGIVWFEHPDNMGNLEIYPEIHDGRFPKIVVVGDPEGLRFLADVVHKIANIDQKETNHPQETRFHIHLYPDSDLGDHSCEVEICRADDKDTGEFPDFMRRREKEKNRKKKVK